MWYNQLPDAIFVLALMGTLLMTVVALFSPEPLRFGMAAIAFGLVMHAYKPA